MCRCILRQFEFTQEFPIRTNTVVAARQALVQGSKAVMQIGRLHLLQLRYLRSMESRWKVSDHWISRFRRVFSSCPALKFVLRTWLDFGIPHADCRQRCSVWTWTLTRWFAWRSSRMTRQRPEQPVLSWSSQTMAKLSNLLPSAVHATEALVATLAMFCSTFTGLG